MAPKFLLPSPTSQTYLIVLAEVVPKMIKNNQKNKKNQKKKIMTKKTIEKIARNFIKTSKNPKAILSSQAKNHSK